MTYSASHSLSAVVQLLRTGGKEALIRRHVSEDQFAQFEKVVGDAVAARTTMAYVIFLIVLFNLPEGHSSEDKAWSERLARVKAARRHAAALWELVDDDMAPALVLGSAPGYEDVDMAIARLEEMKGSLRQLATALNQTATFVRVSPGRPRQRRTSEMWLLKSCRKLLLEAGLRDGTADRSRMVSAIRICWEVAGLEGDVRDLLRDLRKERGGQ
jgi:hypothetical protein